MAPGHQWEESRKEIDRYTEKWMHTYTHAILHYFMLNCIAHDEGEEWNLSSMRAKTGAECHEEDATNTINLPHTC